MIKRVVKKLISLLVFLLKRLVFWVKKAYNFLLCVFKKIDRYPVNEDALQRFNELYEDSGCLTKQNGFKYDEIVYDLTIIIPVFNCERFIEECLQSVFSQMTKYSYEVIIINDGSDDNSMDILAKYDTYKNVTILDQSNQGQSVARNNGIYHSKGKYIMMIDADDVLADDAIETLMELAISSGSDIAEGNITRFYESSDCRFEQPVREKTTVFSNQKNPKFVLTCYGYSVAKVYKRELWSNVRYPEGYIFEDMISKYVLRRKANQVAFTNRVVYGYRWSANSSSHASQNGLKKLDSIRVFPKIVEMCEQNGFSNDEVFYMLALAQVGLLNYITTKSLDESIKHLCFEVARKQLKSVSPDKDYKLPILMKKLEKSIIYGDYDAWEMIASTIHKYGFLKKYREIN